MRRKLAETTNREAELLRKARELDEREQQIQVETERKITEETARIRDQVAQLAEKRLETELEKQRLGDEEKRQQIDTLQRKVEELQRTLRQGSQQVQGEAQEVLLRDVLTQRFPFDLLDDVPKGVNGADVVQRVRSSDGYECGTILWESKRTKSWSDAWLPKLRDDQRETRAALAVIVTEALPTGMRHFALVDGVWVCGWTYAASLATVLRSGMIDLAHARRAAEGREDKMQMLYGYLTGSEFKTRVTGIMEAFSDLQEDLASERRAMLTRWKRREKQLQRALVNVTGLYGDLQGIAGAKLADIPALSLRPLPQLSGDLDDHEFERVDNFDGQELSNIEETQPELVELLFELLPEDGSAVGNGTLTDRFADSVMTRFGVVVDGRMYERCKGALLAAGRARRGKGRGGSVARAVDEREINESLDA